MKRKWAGIEIRKCDWFLQPSSHWHPQEPRFWQPQPWLRDRPGCLPRDSRCGCLPGGQKFADWKMETVKVSQLKSLVSNPAVFHNCGLDCSPYHSLWKFAIRVQIQISSAQHTLHPTTVCQWCPTAVCSSWSGSLWTRPFSCQPCFQSNSVSIFPLTNLRLPQFICFSPQVLKEIWLILRSDSSQDFPSLLDGFLLPAKPSPQLSARNWSHRVKAKGPRFA